MATTSDDLGSTYVFSQLDAYPWDTDEEFQGGLRAILGSVQDPSQVEHLTLRAKCYYYARKAGTTVDFNGYQAWVEGGCSDQGAQSDLSTLGQRVSDGIVQLQPAEMEDAGAGGMVDAPKPASFAEICEWIAEGKPIPGIKDIPDTILEGRASEAQTAVRKKPWEKSGTAGEKPSWMT
jgi:hypothetical protein